jgi:hypothetical protein
MSYVCDMKTKLLLLLPLAGLLLVLTGCVTQTYTVVPPPGPNLAQIQSMVQAHVADAYIISQIQNSSTRYNLTADQIITLKKAGASDAVLNALITSVNKPVPQPTTVVTQPVYAYPYYPYPYTYPYVYVNPWPGPYYYGGYYRGGYYWRR